MSAHFKKKSANTKQEIPTASLPDIIFMLLIFFMVTTVLRETELLVNVSIPAAEAIEKMRPRLVEPEEGEELKSYIIERLKRM